MNHALPNKLFEYIAAGVPIIVANADTAAQFVTQLGIGVVLPTLEPTTPIDIVRLAWVSAMKEALTEENQKRCKANILKHRDKFTMDAQIGAITGLYNDVMTEVRKHGTRRNRTINRQTFKSKKGKRGNENL